MCIRDRSADSTVDGSALYAAITCCPQSPDCCPPCAGNGVRVAPDSPPNLSAAVISRLTAEWKDEYDRWQKRDLSRNTAPAVLGAQDGERVEQGRAVGTGEHEEGLARSLLGPESSFGRGGDRCLRREIR